MEYNVIPVEETNMVYFRFWNFLKNRDSKKHRQFYEGSKAAACFPYPLLQNLPPQ